MTKFAGIASAAMMLRYSFRMDSAAEAIETAIEKVLKRGARTAEIPGKGRAAATSRMGDRIATETQKLLESQKRREGYRAPGMQHYAAVACSLTLWQPGPIFLTGESPRCGSHA